MTTLDELIGEFGCPSILQGGRGRIRDGGIQGLESADSHHLLRGDSCGDRPNTPRSWATLSDRGSTIAANMVEESDSRYLFDYWVTIDEFSDRLEDKLPRCANVVLKMAEPRQEGGGSPRGIAPTKPRRGPPPGGRRVPGRRSERA